MKVEVPDIGDFTDVPVIEIHVSAGDRVDKEQSLITLESDKATMDVPAPAAGTVTKLLVSLDDEVSKGTPILELDVAKADEPETESEESREEPSEPTEPTELPDADRRTQVLVIGSGPGGYTAAFRAADLGLDVTLVERYPTLGGVCLNVGCIPSKALLHAARVSAEAEEASAYGIDYGTPKIDLAKLRGWKDDVVGKLVGGVGGMAKQRSVDVVEGEARFTGDHTVAVGDTTIAFEHCIIAAGSRSVELPDQPDDDRIVDSTEALELADVPGKLLVVGGGIIGLELATVYAALGSKVTVVELTDGLMPGTDRDLVKPLRKRIEQRYEAIHTAVGVASMKPQKRGIKVDFEGDEAPRAAIFDRVLVAVGRRANGDRLDVEAAGVGVDERGVIAVDEQRRTNVSHIFAIGDITGAPMLAHKATHEAAVAAEVIAGHDVAFDPRAIPAVAYTDPEVAWTGVTETDPGDQELEKAVFPWSASGRALALSASDGLTKLLVDPETRRVVGAGVVGPNAGDLIAEPTLAIELGADAQDIALTIHPHPTLSETIGMAGEVAEGTVTDLPHKRRR